ncbi:MULTISPECIES: flavin reductase family protein [Amycolatopsis]|uniref:Flavin reductase family protein n=1 Tax=Amycolatopsis albidoflavus TaxID=102226 RepID=A0ABW5IBM2_9PSEU
MTNSLKKLADESLLDGFRSMMRSFPTGVAVVTALDEAGEPVGMTCSAVCSVTLAPPTLLVCLRVGPTLKAVTGGKIFAVNFLHSKARAVAELFASGAADRFDHVTWAAGANGGPRLVRDAHVIACCRVSKTEPVGDHVVVFGEVETVEEQDGHRPLLYGRRRYHAWPSH